MYQYPLTPDEIYHHGILGQRWGQKNGPPYPLSSSRKSKIEKKAEKLGMIGVIDSSTGKRYNLNEISKRDLKRTVKKYEHDKKQAEEEAARKQAEEEAKARHDADKERVLREGSATEIRAYINELTNAELKAAVDRIQTRNTLLKLSEKDIKNGWQIVDEVMKKVGKIKDWTKTGTEFANAIDDAMKLIQGDKNKQTQNPKSKSK